MKRILLVLLVVFLVVLGLTTECYKDNSLDKDPNLAITLGDETIQCTLIKNIAAQADINRNIYKEMITKSIPSDIKYIKFNQEIKFDYGEMTPDKVLVRDILIKPNGDFLFSNKEIVDVPLTNKDNYYSFIVIPHICSALKSENTVDYRAFIISAVWGKDEYTAAFVINTDD